MSNHRHGHVLFCKTWRIIDEFEKIYSYKEKKSAKFRNTIGHRRFLINTSYLQDQRKCCSFLFMEDSVLVQFARSSAVVLGWHFKVCGSTPGISQARMTARYWIRWLKLLNDVAIKPLILVCLEVCWTRRWRVLCGPEIPNIYRSLKQDKS